jgi:hypothetical protein
MAKAILNKKKTLFLPIYLHSIFILYYSYIYFIKYLSIAYMLPHHHSFYTPHTTQHTRHSQDMLSHHHITYKDINALT